MTNNFSQNDLKMLTPQNDEQKDAGIFDKFMNFYRNLVSESKGKLEPAKADTDEEQQKIYKTLKTLKDYSAKEKEFTDNQTNLKAIMYALHSFGPDADLDTVKELISNARKEANEEAVSKYLQNNRIDNMRAVKNSEPSLADEWFSKSDIDKMSDSDYVKNGDKIMKQMNLEKQGKLPRRII